MRLIISILSLLSAMGLIAQQYRTSGEYTSDIDGTKIQDAVMELALTKDQDDYTILSLKIYPDQESNYALVDTLWRRESAYRTEGTVKTDKYEERNTFFLYSFDTTGRLDTYYVFSQFIDTTGNDFSQIVVRKFAADGKRIWCMAANASEEGAVDFFKILNDARKKLRFKKTTNAKGEGRDKPRFEEPRERRIPSTIGHGSPYGSGW